MKPQSLQQVEGALWRCILRIVSGASAVTQLSLFVQEYHILTQSLEDSSPELIWYTMPCMCLKTLLCYNLIVF
jgi:hypothetical protein